tara:strand:- start:6133 stop:6267 length:135 start_codon:yes stop_codon:yes gene_type:complete
MKSKQEKKEAAQARSLSYTYANSKAKRTGSATEAEWNKARGSKS